MIFLYRSLCIVDEFGKGTLSADGVGLLCATLRHFASQPRCPKIILSTHFSEVRGLHSAAMMPASRQASSSCQQALHSAAGELAGQA